MVHRTIRLCPFALSIRSTYTPTAPIKPTCQPIARGFAHSANYQRNLLKKYLPSLSRQSQPQNQNGTRDEVARENAPKDGRQKVVSPPPFFHTSSVPGSALTVPPPSILSSSTPSSIASPPATPHTHSPADPVEVQARIPISLPRQETKSEEETNIEGDGPFEILGLKVPERPIKPGDEDCCMSGCAVCIHDIYASSYEEYALALEAARVALSQSTVPRMLWPVRVLELDKEITRSGNEPDPFVGLDPGMRAFMELEARLKATPAGLNGSGE